MMQGMKCLPFTLILLSTCLLPLQAAVLTESEIDRMEADLGITLTAYERSQVARIAKPEGILPQWRIDAEARIEEHRKASLQVEVVDQNGLPVEGAQVEVQLRHKAFKFGGVLSVRDMNNVNNVLTNSGNSTEAYQSLFLELFNGVGLDNGFKPKQRAGNEALLPGFLQWAEDNELPVRGHNLIWPGVSDESNHLPADILADVQAVEAAIAAGEDGAVIDALKLTLKTNIDALIAEWAALWPVYEWDVINEPLSNRRVQELLGYQELSEWFKIAAANVVRPETGLLINEFQIISANSQNTGSQGYGRRSSRYKAYIDRILSEGGPLDRIGFQSRFKFEHPDPVIIYNRLEDFANTYGLLMAGTEFEIRDTVSGPYTYDFSEEERAEITEEMMTTYFSHPLVDGFFAWTYMKNEEWSLCYLDGSLKLNALVWYYLQRIRYHTQSNGFSNASGLSAVRGFKGSYDVSVSLGGVTYDSQLVLDADKVHRVVVQNNSGTGSWGKYTILNEVYADTGPWMGWLEVGDKPWIWSLSLGDWLFVPGASADTGSGWVYFLN
jgi:GH35 family endo-1,4-beta-xylanase